MSCRETGAGSALTSYARYAAGRAISEQATLSTFHQMRNAYLSREPGDRPVVTETQYRSYLSGMRAVITADQNLTEAQRRSLLGRLDRADAEAMPDAATAYGVVHVRAAVATRADSLDGFLRGIAGRTGEPVATVRTRFETLAAGRTSRNTTGLSDDLEATAAARGLARDAGTVHAMAQLESEARHIEAVAASRAPQRIGEDNRIVVPADQEQTGIAGITIDSVGYDPRNGRLEVAVHDAADGSTTIHAYRHVDAGTWQSMQHNAGQAWYSAVRGNPDYQYDDDDTAMLDGAAPRCPDCGQFAAASHSCPALPEPAPAAPRETTRMRQWGSSGRWTTQEASGTVTGLDGTSASARVRVSLPPIRRLAQAANNGEAQVEVNQWMWVSGENVRAANYNVTGTYSAVRNEDRTYTVTAPADARCNCQAYRDNGHCEHIDLVRTAIQSRLDSTRTPRARRDPAAEPVVTEFGRYDYDTGRRTFQETEVFQVTDTGDVRASRIGVSLPPIRRMQAAAAAGGARVEISQGVSLGAWNSPTRDRDNGTVSGWVVGTRDENREYHVDARELRCTCTTYTETGHCEHVDLIGRAAHDRLARPNAEALAARTEGLRATAVAAAQDRIQAAAVAAVASDWTRDPATAADAAATWRTESDILYSENPAAFVHDVEIARAERAAKQGVPAIPYMRENALDGLARRGSGKAFGIEIEYEMDAGMTPQEKRAAQTRIGRELYEAGLTYSPDMQPYRASGGRGFRDTHADANGVGNWSWERDGSVDGELVTPGMYDEPETWDKLEQALTILRRNGATASLGAGAHVHVGTGEYAGSAAEYSELARMVTQHEDVLVRLASNPSRGSHRNNGYSKPLPAVPPSGFADVNAAKTWQGTTGRYATMNLANCMGTSSDHPEFRVFDSTLDPGAIQTQVKIAVAMTEAARRNAAAGGTTRGKEAWGAHKRRETFAAISGETPPEDETARLVYESTTTRSLLDTLFRRREDKAQAAAVWACTTWSAAPN